MAQKKKDPFAYFSETILNAKPVTDLSPAEPEKAPAVEPEPPMRGRPRKNGEETAFTLSLDNTLYENLRSIRYYHKISAKQVITDALAEYLMSHPELLRP